MQETRHLYRDPAWLWPVWGAAGAESAHYCRFVMRFIRARAKRPVCSLLDIGGGKNAFNLKKRFRVTGPDISNTMLAQARKLNPECEIIRADLPTFRLGRRFDAILMDDALSHMNAGAAWRTALAETGGSLRQSVCAGDKNRYSVCACTRPLPPTARCRNRKARP